jgi:hypothetical protein
MEETVMNIRHLIYAGSIICFFLFTKIGVSAETGMTSVQSSAGQVNQPRAGEGQTGVKPEGRDAPLWDKDQENVSKKLPSIRIIKEGILSVDNILVNKKAGAVTMTGEVNMQDGLVEYLACGKQGKLHESVLKIDAEPYSLQIALLLLNLEPGESHISRQGANETPEGDPVVLWVMWKGEDNKMVKHRAEELLMDVKTKTPMPKPNWVFTGSTVLQGRFMAQVEKSIVAIYHDPYALIDHQLAAGADDTKYIANSKILPPVGTQVSFVIQSLKHSNISAPVSSKVDKSR